MHSALYPYSVATQHALPDNCLTRGYDSGFLSYCPNLPRSHRTLPVDSNRSGSRRSKPSSRSVLMGEHPHPWPRLHGQDTESRHRSNKPAGRYGLAPQTIQLSPEYLFCRTRASLIGYWGSLSLAFAPGFRNIENPVKPSFAFVLYARVLNGLRRPLDPSDPFSEGCRPS